MKTLKNRIGSALTSCHQVLDVMLHKAVAGFPGGKVGGQTCGGHQPKRLWSQLSKAEHQQLLCSFSIPLIESFNQLFGLQFLATGAWAATPSPELQGYFRRWAQSKSQHGPTRPTVILHTALLASHTTNCTCFPNSLPTTPTNNHVKKHFGQVLLLPRKVHFSGYSRAQHWQTPSTYLLQAPSF